jgi:protein-S-isoprenylcysteine O-methyltransferase Ste14
MAITWAGIAVNRWARRILGQNYRSMVTVVEDHEVIDAGPYTLVRHPMYLGTTMICLGVGATLATWPTAIAWALPPLALVRRISVEERVLTEMLGERYESYSSSRARLVPGLW